MGENISKNFTVTPKSLVILKRYKKSTGITASAFVNSAIVANAKRLDALLKQIRETADVEECRLLIATLPPKIADAMIDELFKKGE